MKNTRIVVAALAISGLGIAGITQWEGFRNTAYLDVGQVPTIGYGSTKDVKMGDVITEPEARKRLLTEVRDVYEKAVQTCVHVPLYQHEYDAYVSLTYNIGANAFCKSTLVRLLNNEQYEEACNQILRWNKVKGVVSKGLTNRRMAEHKKCLGTANNA